VHAVIERRTALWERRRKSANRPGGRPSAWADSARLRPLVLSTSLVTGTRACSVTPKPDELAPGPGLLANTRLLSVVSATVEPSQIPDVGRGRGGPNAAP